MQILPNNVAVIGGDSHHAVWCAKEGLVHDKWMANILKGIIAECGIHTALDIGANIGTLAYPMLEAGARVICFEANPEACRCLEYNLTVFPPSQYTIFNLGVGDEGGHAFIRKDKNAGASWVACTPGADSAPISIVAIDDCNYDPGLIKMDIEGMEHHALLGAEKTIERCRPVLVLEINDGALARQGRDPGYIFSFLMHRYYSMRILQPDCMVGDPQYDIVCYPRR